MTGSCGSPENSLLSEKTFLVSLHILLSFKFRQSFGVSLFFRLLKDLQIFKRQRANVSPSLTKSISTTSIVKREFASQLTPRHGSPASSKVAKIERTGFRPAATHFLYALWKDFGFTPSRSSAMRCIDRLQYLFNSQHPARQECFTSKRTTDSYTPLTDSYLGLSPEILGVAAQHQIAASQHREITLGLYFWKQPIKRNVQHTVKEIRLFENRAASIAGSTSTNSTHGLKDEPGSDKMAIIGEHDKCVRGWSLPAGYPGIWNCVRTSMGGHIQEICHECAGPR